MNIPGKRDFSRMDDLVLLVVVVLVMAAAVGSAFSLLVPAPVVAYADSGAQKPAPKPPVMGSQPDAKSVAPADIVVKTVNVTVPPVLLSDLAIVEGELTGAVAVVKVGSAKAGAVVWVPVHVRIQAVTGGKK